MKKTALLAVLLVIAAALIFTFGGCKRGETGQGKVVLTMGSWRADDVAQMNNLLAEYGKIKPNVEIQFRPTNPPDYNATLRLQLEGGTGPDLMYARSYATGQELFNAGYFGDCTDILGVRQNFTASNAAPWQMPDGRLFAVPFAAVSHAVYYNKTIFQREGLSVPQTWEDFLALCQTLASRGLTPLANGVADEWDILETFFLGILPNYIGGAAERVKYETGEKRLNDADFTAAFQGMADIAGYLPRGYESVTYNDSQALFNTQQAVMFMDGSWTIGVYSDAPFEWGLFAAPAPRGKNTAVCFHPDMAITWNAGTRYPDECKDFLAWLATREGAATASAALPLGFFPMINAQIQLTNAQANECLSLNSGKETDARFVWPKFMDLYAPMNQAVIQVIRGQMTPRQAADAMEVAAARLR
ncbi:MAG: extracellular solute-binding protein [Treponema sp.]|nr:extracellular solute-binding protein [Treponema sp.]